MSKNLIIFFYVIKINSFRNISEITEPIQGTLNVTSCRENLHIRHDSNANEKVTKQRLRGWMNVKKPLNVS